MWGTQGTGTEALECGEIRRREPGKERLIVIGSGDGVSEREWCGTEGVFGCEQQAVALVAGIGCEQEVAAGGGQCSGGGTTGMQGIGGGTRKGAGEDDGAVSALGQVDEGR